MQTEELVRGGGLFSGLEAKGKLNQLLDEFYGNRLQEEEKAPQCKRTGALTREVTQHFFEVPPGLESAAKKKETLQQSAPVRDTQPTSKEKGKPSLLDSASLSPTVDFSKDALWAGFLSKVTRRTF